MTGIGVPTTPNLERLFCPRVSAWSPVALEPDGAAPSAGGILSTRKCSVCAGDGLPRRTREASAARGAYAKRATRRSSAACRGCGGRGYVFLDARPGIEPHESLEPDPLISEWELMRHRARRMLPRVSREVGERWYSETQPRGVGLYALWPLTQAGRDLYAEHRGRRLLRPRWDCDLAAAADRTALALLTEAESYARGALVAVGAAS